MSNDLVLALQGQLPAHLQGAGPSDDLSEGVGAAYPSMSIKGKTFAIKHRGHTTALMRSDGTGPMGALDVVIVKASPAISKNFYPNGYKDGDDSAPACFSTDGVKPDAGCASPQASACATCEHNKWGSRITEAGEKGKACSDLRRVAIVPSDDLRNVAYGGPMLLRIPAASLGKLADYNEALKKANTGYFAVRSQMTFDPTVAFPKLLWKAMRYLTAPEFEIVKELQLDPQVTRMLSEPVVAAKAEGGSPEIPGANPVASPGPLAGQTAQVAVTAPVTTGWTTAPTVFPGAVTQPAQQAQVANPSVSGASKPNPFAAQTQAEVAAPPPLTVAPPPPPLPPPAPKVEPAPDPYQYQSQGDVRYRWKPGMAAWEVVPSEVAAEKPAPKPRKNKTAAPSPTPADTTALTGAVTNGQAALQGEVLAPTDTVPAGLADADTPSGNGSAAIEDMNEKLAKLLG